MLHTALGTAAALLGVAFALSTYERWVAYRRRHDLAWSGALAMFAIASGAMAAGAGGGWDEPTFRVFYLFGAIVNVPFLALGTVYLLGGRRTGDRWAVVVCLLAAFAAGVLVSSDLTAPIDPGELPRGSEVFGPLPRVLAAVASGVGALVVFAGAVWSAIRHRRGRMVAANALIALGTAITSASGILNSVVDEMTGFAITLVAGIALIFAGFMVAVSARPQPAPAAAIEARGEGASRRGPSAGRAVGRADAEGVSPADSQEGNGGGRSGFAGRPELD